MDRNKQTRRVLLVAFALSLLIHLMWAASVQWRLPIEDDTQRPLSVHVVRLLRLARVVRTPRPPAPPAAPSPRPAHSSAPAKVHGGSGSGTRPSTAAPVPTPAPSALPTPVASATPDCAKLDIPAGVAASPQPADIAPAIRSERTSGTTRVRVQIDPNGTITGAQVITSSGNTSLDVVAVTIARSARYTPATHQCKAVASYYDFTAKFVAW